jgi:tRNA(fMet)-specific endonuclease VapC
MSGDFLLDTNVVIRLMQGEPEIRERVAAASATYLSIVAAAELFYGAEKSTRREANLERVERFLTPMRLIDL